MDIVLVKSETGLGLLAGDHWSLGGSGLEVEDARSRLQSSSVELARSLVMGGNH